MKRNLGYERVEARHCLSGISFADHNITMADVAAPDAMLPTDVDGDGDIDILFAGDGKIGWYENSGSPKGFSGKHIVDANVRFVRSSGHADIDNDGDLDIQVIQYDSVRLYQNVDGRGEFEEISPDVEVGQARFADLDGDGDQDLVGVNRTTDLLVWLPNDGGEFGESRQISASRHSVDPRSIDLGDLDNDGDVDMIAILDERLIWFENIGDASSFARHPINYSTSGIGRLEFVEFADINGDGSLDILAADAFVMWFENLGMTQEFSDAQRLPIKFGSIESLQAADLDGDGDTDIVGGTSRGFIASRNGLHFGGSRLFWFENTDGLSTFEFREIASDLQSLTSMVVSDIDQDGDVDMAYVSQQDATIGWHENVDSASTFAAHAINNSGTAKGSILAVSDMDADGDIDLLTSTDISGEKRWYENLDNSNSFTPRLRQFETTSRVLMIDVDGDGDADFVPPTPQFDIGDLNGDGLDNIGAWSSGKISWYENFNRFGIGVFGPPQDVSYSRSVGTVTVGDIDGDGDLDILHASDAQVSWAMNIDGQGNFQTMPLEPTGLGNNWLITGDLVDFDIDGDLDVVVSMPQGFEWFENLDGLGAFSKPQSYQIANHDFAAMVVGDLNDDGLVDVIIGAESFNSNTRERRAVVEWFQNTGAGFLPGQIIAKDIRVSALKVADLDGDSDMDLVYSSSIESSLGWLESDLADQTIEKPISGDANRDGSVDMADFAILAANFQATAAVWEDGDFDGDSVISFLDFLALAKNFGVQG